VPVDGLVKVDLEVRRREPVAGDAPAAPEAGTDVASAAAPVDHGKGGR